MIKKLFCLLLLPSVAISQIQIGQKLVGLSNGDAFGFSVAISQDGTTIASGASQYRINGFYYGQVRVFKYVAGIWKQVGSDIIGHPYTYGGYDLSLSSDGNIIAISMPTILPGRIRIYKNISGVWTQVGQDIYDSTNTGGFSGTQVSLSADGNIVAVCVRTLPESYLRVYKNISDVWTQTGLDIPVSAMDLTGANAGISLSSDGSVIALGTWANDDYGNNAGKTKVYRNVSGIWTQIGQDIYGEVAGAANGSSVSLSSDGNILAVGEPGYNINGTLGRVKIYENKKVGWTQIGQAINGETANYYYGGEVSLSGDGNIVAVGGPGNAANGTSSGHVRIFRNTGGNWTQVGIDIDGEAAYDVFGKSVALSANGNVVVIGAPQPDSDYVYITSNKKGYIKAYDLSEVLSSDRFVKDNFNIYPNPATNVLYITLENNLLLEKVILYNHAGQIVKTANETPVDISSLAKGVYHVEVTTDKGKASRKVMVN